MSGLGDLRAPVQVVDRGVYVAYNSDAVFRSTDGLHWTRLEIHPAK